MQSGGLVVDEPVYDEELFGGIGRLVATPSYASLHIRDVATYEVRGGVLESCESSPGADPARVELWRVGTVAVLELAQRGVVCLHGSSGDVGGKAVVVAGLSGAGKSTTVLELGRRGHRLVGDDISPLLPDAESGISLEPSGRPLHVWPEAAQRVGLEVPEHTPTVPGTTKLILPAPPPRRIAVGAIFLLCVDDVGSPELSRLRPSEAIPHLSAMIHCGSVLRRVWPEKVLSWAAAVAASVPVHLLVRPREGWTADLVADAVEEGVRCG